MRDRQVTFMLCITVAASLVSDGSIARADESARLYRESYRLEAQRDYRGALARIESVRGRSRSYFATLRGAWLAYLLADHRSSAAGYRAAAALAPRAIEPRLGLTLPLLAARRWRELERACREALGLDPKSAVARARLAHAQYSLGNYPDAAGEYRRLVADYPSELDHQTGLAWALARMGRRDEARRLFEAVLAVSPDNASARAGTSSGAGASRAVVAGAAGRRL
jgi:tetratricopeptide (TPR) repeat protein